MIDRTLAALAAATLLAACAGYRGGWESVPYLGETPPALDSSRTPYEAQRRSELNLPGLTLGVGLNNQLRTYDTQVYLFVLPLSVDPRNVQTQRVEPGKTRVSLRITQMTADLVFRPRLARLTVGKQVVEGTAGFQFAMWDEQGREVGSGGRWDHQPTGDERALEMRGKGYLVNIDFPIPTPSPEAGDITLDLSGALSSPQLPRLPPIRFAPVRWKEGYT